jgi:hypothetical protein
VAVSLFRVAVSRETSPELCACLRDNAMGISSAMDENEYGDQQGDFKLIAHMNGSFVMAIRQLLKALRSDTDSGEWVDLMISFIAHMREHIGRFVKLLAQFDDLRPTAAVPLSFVVDMMGRLRDSSIQTKTIGL